MGRWMLMLAPLALLLVTGQSARAETGWLLLPADPSMASRDGAQASTMVVYREEDGEQVSAPGLSGAWDAGIAVEVDAGWYVVDVGTERTLANLRRLQVVPGHVTVVPTGWLSVRTLPVSRQPTQGCAGWNAELSVYVDDGDGGTARVATNRDSGVRDYGAVQLPAGTYRVVFNGLPATVDVASRVDVPLPLGWQDPVAGREPQLAIPSGSLPGSARISLCTDGSVQVPAGEYVAAGVTEIPEYPYERRDWVRVVVTPDEAREAADLAEPDTEAPIWRGEGSEGEPVPADAPVLEQLRDGARTSGPRFEGFGR